MYCAVRTYCALGLKGAEKGWKGDDDENRCIGKEGRPNHSFINLKDRKWWEELYSWRVTKIAFFLLFSIWRIKWFSGKWWVELYIPGWPKCLSCFYQSEGSNGKRWEGWPLVTDQGETIPTMISSIWRKIIEWRMPLLLIIAWRLR